MLRTVASKYSVPISSLTKAKGGSSEPNEPTLDPSLVHEVTLISLSSLQSKPHTYENWDPVTQSIISSSHFHIHVYHTHTCTYIHYLCRHQKWQHSIDIRPVQTVTRVLLTGSPHTDTLGINCESTCDHLACLGQGSTSQLKTLSNTPIERYM